MRHLHSDRISRGSQKRYIAIFHLGLLGVVAVFLLFLFRNYAIRDWIIQSFKIGGHYVNSSRPAWKMILKFTYGLVSAKAAGGGQDLRAWLYTFIFFNNIVIARRIFSGFLKRRPAEKELFFFLFCLVTFFGYFQSLHLYELLRLQNAASLGIGILVFALYHDAVLSGKRKKRAFDLPVICVFAYLMMTSLFIRTSSTYRPWDKKLLFSKELKSPDGIDIFKGKLYASDVRTYYQSLYQALGNYRGGLPYLINFTRDSFIPLLSGYYQRVQKAPFYDPELSQRIFSDEQKEITRVFTEAQAILFTDDTGLIPKNYRVILVLRVPDLPYIAKMTYVAIPGGPCGDTQP